jgi:hypothetical protein
MCAGSPVGSGSIKRGDGCSATGIGVAEGFLAAPEDSSTGPDEDPIPFALLSFYLSTQERVDPSAFCAESLRQIVLSAHSSL